MDGPVFGRVVVGDKTTTGTVPRLAVEANQAQAITWLQRAADAGYARANRALSAIN